MHHSNRPPLPSSKRIDAGVVSLELESFVCACGCGGFVLAHDEALTFKNLQCLINFVTKQRAGRFECR